MKNYEPYGLPQPRLAALTVGDVGFRREMLLQVVPEEGQDVLAEDIHYYDDPPFDDGNYMGHGGDLAISTKESADCTSLVSGEVSWSSGTLEIYVQPNAA